MNRLLVRGLLSLRLVLSLGLLSAPAWAALQSACGTPEDRPCCCCPEGSTAHPCAMNCSEEPSSPNDSAALIPASGTSVFKSTYALEPTANSSAQAATPLVLAAAPSHLTHAPPPKRYLLACVFRL